MRKKLVLAVVSTLAVAALAAPVLAHRGAERMMHARIKAHVEEAFDQINATPQQRAAITSALEQVESTIKDRRGDRFAKLNDAAAVFAAEKLDATKVAGLRAYHDREADKLADTAIQAVYDVHAALTPAQRQKLVAYVQQEMPKSGAGWRQKWLVNMIDYRLADIYDQLKATPEQRQKLTAVKDGAVQAWFAGRDDRRAALNSALQLFAADTLDKQKVAELKRDYLAKHKALADRVEAAVREVHATLTPDQRRAAIDFAKAHRRHQ